jgi:transposase
MPPAYVKPYAECHKNDASDAEAICEALTRPSVRFVATKAPEQQSCLTLRYTRHLFIRPPALIWLSLAPLRRYGVTSGCPRLRACVIALGGQLRILKARIMELDRMRP